MIMAASPFYLICSGWFGADECLHLKQVKATYLQVKISEIIDNKYNSNINLICNNKWKIKDKINLLDSSLGLRLELGLELGFELGL